MRDELKPVKAILFDVFGTVVDWRGSILRELEAVGQKHGIVADWPSFADQWRLGYNEGSRAFLAGQVEWKKADTFHWERLNALKAQYGLDRLSEDELKYLNKAWHRLAPWPDAVEGLGRLKAKYVIGTLSNGNNGLLVHMAKNGGLPWDVVMGAENFQSFKPDPKVYLGAVDLLGYERHEVMIAAAHLSDLYQARKNGLRAGFVTRLDEFGVSEREPDREGDERIDVTATDFLDLAEQLGA